MFDEKIVSVNSESTSEIVSFSPIMVIFGDFLRKRLKNIIIALNSPVAHFEIQNYFQLDKSRFTLV